MERFVIEGGVPLRGEVRVAGAKNAVLKMMAAAILTDEPVVLRNVPRISDVAIMRETMADIGFAWTDVDEHTLELRGRGPEWLFVPLEAAMKMRSSFILLGPLLARHGRVIISNPGGDRIGRRPVDLHVEAMRTLGAEIEYRNGYYFARRRAGCAGARIAFPYVTVMGTENALLAACLADGHDGDRERRPGARGRRPGGHAAGDGRPHRADRAARPRGRGGGPRCHGVEHPVSAIGSRPAPSRWPPRSSGGEVTVSGVRPGPPRRLRRAS